LNTGISTFSHFSFRSIVFIGLVSFDQFPSRSHFHWPRFLHLVRCGSIKLVFVFYFSLTSYIHIIFQFLVTLYSDQSVDHVAVASKSNFQSVTRFQFAYYTLIRKTFLILFLISTKCTLTSLTCKDGIHPDCHLASLDEFLSPKSHTIPIHPNVPQLVFQKVIRADQFGFELIHVQSVTDVSSRFPQFCQHNENIPTTILYCTTYILGT
jgi:hypothetical protein